MVALRRFDPHGFQTKCGFACGDAFQLAIHMTRIDRQLTADFDFALATHHAFEHDVVSVWVDVQVITDTHGLNQEAQLGRQFFTHAFDAGHQLAASFSVDQGNQAVTNFQTNQVDLVHIVPVEFFWRVGRRSVFDSLFSLLVLHFTRHDHQA